MRSKWMLGAVLFFAVSAAQAQEPTAAERGRARYLRYCAACHGKDAAGDGPMAASLRAQPPDLRRIAERHGRFEPAAVASKIDGRAMASPHGSAEMPVWGWKGFRARKGSAGRPSDRMREMLAYLESIQIQPKP